MNPVPIPPGMETRLFLLENDALNQLPEATRSPWGTTPARGSSPTTTPGVPPGPKLRKF